MLLKSPRKYDSLINSSPVPLGLIKVIKISLQIEFVTKDTCTLISYIVFLVKEKNAGGISHAKSVALVIRHYKKFVNKKLSTVRDLPRQKHLFSG